MLRPLFALTKSLPLPPFAYFIPEQLERGGREGLGERWGEGLPPPPPAVLVLGVVGRPADLGAPGGPSGTVCGQEAGPVVAWPTP